MKKAFTLIELIVALSIMALIMGLSLTAFDSTKNLPGTAAELISKVSDQL